MSLGGDIADAALDDTRKLLGDAIAFRREHPFYFYRIWHYEALRWGPKPGQRHKLWQRFRWFVARRQRDKFRSRALAMRDVRESCKDPDLL